MLRQLVKHGSVMTAGNVVAGLFSYAFMIIAARGLGPTEFGALGALLSLFYMASSLISAIITLVSRNVAEARARDPEVDITHLVRSPIITVGVHSIIVFAIYAALSPSLNRLLNIDNLPAVVLLGVFCVIAALNGVLRGSLQGVHHFGAVALAISCEALLRLLIGIVCFLIGFSLLGALLAYLCSTAICLFLTLPMVPLNWRRFFAPVADKAEIQTSRRAYSTALSFVAFAAITQVDMIAAKVYLSAADAGYYAAACNFVKTPFLLIAGSFAMAMFPALVGVRSGTRDGQRLLRITLLAVGACLGGATLICLWLAKPIIASLLGPAFLPLAPWLGLFALAACVPAILAVVMRYVLLSDMRLLVVALAAGTAAEISLLLLFHSTPVSVCGALFAGGVVALVLLSVVPSLRSRFSGGPGAHVE